MKGSRGLEAGAAAGHANATSGLNIMGRPGTAAMAVPRTLVGEFQDFCVLRVVGKERAFL